MTEEKWWKVILKTRGDLNNCSPSEQTKEAMEVFADWLEENDKNDLAAALRWAVKHNKFPRRSFSMAYTGPGNVECYDWWKPDVSLRTIDASPSHYDTIPRKWWPEDYHLVYKEHKTVAEAFEWLASVLHKLPPASNTEEEVA